MDNDDEPAANSRRDSELDRDLGVLVNDEEFEGVKLGGSFDVSSLDDLKASSGR